MVGTMMASEVPMQSCKRTVSETSSHPKPSLPPRHGSPRENRRRRQPYGRWRRPWPASISRELTRLEEHLGHKLFARSTRTLALTEQGQLFCAWARKILDDVEKAQLALVPPTEARGGLRVSAPMLFGRHILGPLLPEYLRRFPKVAPDLVLTDCAVDLIDEGLDVAIRIGRLEDSSLIRRGLGQVRMVTCASPAYLAKHGEPRAPLDLKRHDCLVFAAGSNDAIWRYRSAGERKCSVRVRVRLRTNALDAIVASALEGSGIAHAPLWYVAQHVRSEALVRILQSYERPPSPIQAVFPAARASLPAVRSFVDFLADELRMPDLD